VGCNPAHARLFFSKRALDKMLEEVGTVTSSRRSEEGLADFGGTVFGLSPADFGKFIADETEKWGKVVEAVNIKAG
jgi:hypothetical protein